MSTENRPTTVRLKSPTDLLALVPCTFGFHPENSLVLLTLGAERDGLHARVDLPSSPEDIDAAVAPILQAVRRCGADAAVLVVYSDDPGRAEAAAGSVRAGLRETGVELTAAIRADGTRWYCLAGCPEECCAGGGCPAEGTRYDISTHPFLTQAVFEGRVLLNSRAELAASLVGTDEAARAAVETAAAAAGERLLSASGHPVGTPVPDRGRQHLVKEGQWVERRVSRFLADAVPLTDEEVGRLLVALVSIEVRDVAWATMNRGNAHLHVELWRDVVRRSPRDLLAPAAALLGFAAWLGGNGALAWCAVERAQDAQPDYGLAGLLAQALSAGVPPRSWKPLDRSMLSLFAAH